MRKYSHLLTNEDVTKIMRLIDCAASAILEVVESRQLHDPTDLDVDPHLAEMMFYEECSAIQRRE